jgi:hypothetical protein
MSISVCDVFVDAENFVYEERPHGSRKEINLAAVKSCRPVTVYLKSYIFWQFSLRENVSSKRKYECQPLKG